MYLILERGVPRVRSATVTSTVISPIGISGQEGPIDVLDTFVKVHASDQTSAHEIAN